MPALRSGKELHGAHGLHLLQVVNVVQGMHVRVVHMVHEGRPGLIMTKVSITVMCTWGASSLESSIQAASNDRELPHGPFAC